MSESSEIYYIVLRGTCRQPIFNSDEDRRHFTRVVADATAACRVTVYGYCWLNTEARLAAAMADAQVSHFAQTIADGHVRRLDREVALTGSHFEQKYRGVVVDGQTALLDLVRHIHLAPLKAGLADDPASYPWSSHRVYLGMEAAPWLATDPLLQYFAQADGDARHGYLTYMMQGVDELDTRYAPAGSAPEQLASGAGQHKK